MYNLENISNQHKKINEIIFESINFVKKKVDEAFVCITKTYNTAIVVRYGKPEFIEFNDNVEYFISVYSNFKKGSASSTDLNINSIKNTIFSAINILKYTSSDKFAGLSEFCPLTYNVYNLNLFHLSQLNLQENIKLAYFTEKYALNYDSKIINTEGGFLNSSNRIFSFGNTKGIFASYKSSRYDLSTCVLAKDKNSVKIERDYYFSNSRKINNLQSPKLIGKTCAKRVLLRLHSKKISTQKCPVIFTSDAAVSIFYSLYKSILGMTVCNKSTFLLNSLNKLIFPKWLNIFDNPHILKGIGSAPFDCEGVVTSPRFIIKDGVLKTWLLDSYSSKKLGIENTGHSGGIYNWIFIHKNQISFKELIKTMNTGIVVTDLMGDGVNIINGDYSRGVSGYFIKNNNFEHSVSEITISGNLKDIFKNIVLMSNDYNLKEKIQCGSLLISNMVISGE
ncbi:MAG: metalloprotease PmbA [Buchnera aphidicola (Periphyllus aceris)]|nr:metalloprotease PmbA [Buchnera aphidicola (Periphyllus aceris)]